MRQGAVDRPPDPAVQAEMARDLQLVDAAIALIRRGAATRVTLANLRRGDDIIDGARARAGLRGLRVTVVRSADGGRCALVVDAGAG